MPDVTAAATAPPLAGRGVHFENLHGVRGIAAGLVVVQHVETVKSLLSVPNLYAVPMIRHLGSLAVDAFFSLSGFLITYLLLTELERTGGIRALRFYARRALRIWPLYYLMLVLGFTLLPVLIPTTLCVDPLAPPVGTKVALFALLLPNLAYASMGHIRFLGPLWSIGVEEQFYLVWPGVVKWLRAQRLKTFLLSGLLFLLIVRLAAPHLLAQLVANGLVSPKTSDTILALLWLCRFECMFCGGIAACWLKERGDRAGVSRAAQGASWVLVAWIFATGFDHGVLGPTVSGAVFATWIVLLAGARPVLVSLEGRVFSWLGRISYGTYVYHMAVVLAVASAVPRGWAVSSPWGYNLLLYGGTFGVTLAAASASYQLFERPLLALKSRFAVVASEGVERA